MNRFIIFSFFFFLIYQSYAQDRYMVFFKDKNNSLYSINSPEAFLSQRALDRRSKQSIAISESDLPVNENYVDQIEALGVQTFYTSKWMNGVLVQMDEIQRTQVETLSIVERTEFVAPNAPLSAIASAISEDPIDPSANLAFPQTDLLGIPDMHKEGFKGEGMLIGIFDDGFRNLSSIPYFEHIVNNNRIEYAFNYVGNNSNVENNFHHGLRAMSTIAASGPDYVGTAPESSFVLAVTEDSRSEYSIEEYNWLFAAEAADSAGVDIISTSLGYSNGFSDPRMNYTPDQMDGNTTVITRASNLAASKGILLVTSAGNSGNTAWQIVTAPADSPDVLAVGAIDSEGLLANFSSQGANTPQITKPDVVAIGRFTSLINTSGIATFQSGTSFSAPQLAGLAAGLWQAFPNLTNLELLELIRSSGDKASNPDNQFGHGVPNWNRALGIFDEQSADAPISFSLFPNPNRSNSIGLSVNEGNQSNIIDIQLVKPDGSRVINISKRIFGSYPNLQISLDGLPAGVYILRLFNSLGSSSKKFIKY